MTKKTKTKPQDRRIYCVVAATVQIPDADSHKMLIVAQPLGRQVAQACHAVSKVRVAMVRKDVIHYLKAGLQKGVKALVKALHLSFALETVWCPPITTIILTARDSFELFHVLGLLQKNGTPVYEFYDTEQPDYGSELATVMTAIATEPVTREDMKGILDYLPLWGS